MSRPDLEALVRDYYGNPLAAPYKPFGAVDLAHTVAAHERAKTIAAIRAKATEYVSVPIGPYHVAAALLRDLADDLEADHD